MKKVCIVLATVLVAMAVAVVAAISLMFWAIMIALLSWSVVFLTRTCSALLTLLLCLFCRAWGWLLPSPC